MDTIKYRHYQAGDEKQIVELWNRCIGKDPVTPQRFRHLVLLDVNFDPQGLRIAVDSDKIVGCLYAVKRRQPVNGVDVDASKGWIPWFFVDRLYRRRGVAQKLLDDASEFLGRHDRKEIIFSSYSPNFIVPGIDRKSYPEGYQFLLKNGFATVNSPVAMDISLVDYEMPDEVARLKEERMAEGFAFRNVEDADLYDLLQLAATKFSPGWASAIRGEMLQGMPLSQIFVAKKEERVLGFCLYGAYGGVRERFGPFGVDPDTQGKGIGRILLYHCLSEMRAVGLHGAWFLWTSRTGAAGHLYDKAGFAVTREFDVMRKVMESA